MGIIDGRCRTYKLMGDDGSFVERGGHFHRGPGPGCELAQEDIEIDGIGDFYFTRAQ